MTTVILYTGYVETQSHSGLILTKPGKLTREQAQNSLLEAFNNARMEIWDEARVEIERAKTEAWRKARVLYYKKKLDPNLHDLIFDYIRGDNQDEDSHLIWECLEEEGWSNTLPKTIKNPIVIDNAPVRLGTNDYDE